MCDFHDEYRLLLKDISEAKSSDALIALRQQINLLSRSINDRGFSSYELKVYSEKMNTAIDLLEGKKKNLNGRKFQFKGLKKPRPNFTSDVASSVETTTSLHPSHQFNHINKVIELNSPFKKNHVFLENLDNCIVRVLGEPICESIKVKNAKNSLLLLQAKTSIMIDKAENCVIVSSSLQLRLHDMEKCIIYPSLESSDPRVILESCTGLKFGKAANLISKTFSAKCDFAAIDDFDQPVRNSEPINFENVESILDISEMETKTHIDDGFAVMSCWEV